MANVKFNVACPSCAAALVIRSSAAVGRKMECPKCKYRFVVPQPPAEEPEEPAAEAAAEKAKGKGKKKKEKAKAGNNERAPAVDRQDRVHMTRLFKPYKVNYQGAEKRTTDDPNLTSGQIQKFPGVDLALN